MLITNVLMIEDRCSISLANMLAMYIYHVLYMMKTGAKQTRSFTLTGEYHNQNNINNIKITVLHCVLCSITKINHYEQ